MTKRIKQALCHLLLWLLDGTAWWVESDYVKKIEWKWQITELALLIACYKINKLDPTQKASDNIDACMAEAEKNLTEATRKK